MGDRGINFVQDFQPMRLRRSRVEEIVDKTLQLYLINCVNEKGWLGGITKLMKLLFFAEKEMVESNIKGFNYSFYRWQFGPFTPEVYQDLEYLLDNKLVTDEDKPELTSRGKAFLKSIDEFLEENRAITSCVDAIAEKYAHEWASRLTALAYNTEIEVPYIGVKVPIKMLPMGCPLVSNIDEIKADKSVEINDEWVETLDILLNLEEYESLMESIKSAQNTSSHKVILDQL